VLKLLESRLSDSSTVLADRIGTGCPEFHSLAPESIGKYENFRGNVRLNRGLKNENQVKVFQRLTRNEEAIRHDRFDKQAFVGRPLDSIDAFIGESPDRLPGSHRGKRDDF
jgi:hypothetical protein